VLGLISSLLIGLGEKSDTGNSLLPR